MNNQMQQVQEAIARLKSMSRQELLSALVKAGIANADDAAPSIDESEGGKRGQVTRGNRDGNAV